jgi:hypothetical protein
MTSELISSTFALRSSEQDRIAEHVKAHERLQEMSDVMVAQKGLLNFPQAALLLDVSVKRICELVRLKKLDHWEFLGRKYVSMAQVRDRYQQELKDGRSPLSKRKQLVASVKAALKHDRLQVRQGGYQGPYQKKLREERRKRARNQ